jgi:hypothetical protein
VPNNGNYGSSFGREQLYYGYSPMSAIPEVAGEKTATNGKYTFDSATGQYTWVPAGSTIKADTAADYKSGLSGVGGEGGQDFGGGTGMGGGNSINAFTNSPLGYAVGKASGFFAGPRTGLPAPVEDMVGTPVDIGYAPGTTGSASRDSDTAESGNVDAAPDAPSPGERGGEQLAVGGLTAFASGGLGSLGGYSDGGRLLRGPGDGVSDSIPATIGKAKQPARLADGEFVVPARIVSELGNGSTAAGARKLYAMLARIQAGRKKSIGKSKVAVNSRMDKHLPA